ncbi:MAG TPA: hypothetical protein VJ552_11880 [Sediminibacterium sp.]|nr:hypothetical protein [Sediminibacterium sp.]
MNKKKKNILLLLLALICLAGAGAFYAYKEFNRKAADLSGAEAAYRVTAVELISDFTANEAGSNAKYLSQVIEISGTLKKTDQDEKGNKILVLGDSSSMSSVRCSLDSLYSSTAVFEQGSRVKIKGLCTGFMADDLGIGSDVILTRCVPAKQ